MANDGRRSSRRRRDDGGAAEIDCAGSGEGFDAVESLMTDLGCDDGRCGPAAP